ncbi:MAG: GNAT family N-acetyltransferase, partial [Marinobacter sp.]|uniref:GNAT family N-acetyltransferase n=1 Tax=Marinobacter sp. TaxID=50741 RepID=UPI00299D2671
LGMGAVAWLRQNSERGSDARVVVTAASPEAVRTLFHHAREVAGSDAQQGSDGLSLTLAEGQTLQFYAIDRLLRERPTAGLVLVDEAAAIPAPQLSAILLAWPRVVYATTVHGYEGSGRGFTLRFRAQLERQSPGWHALTLSRPIRWAPEDPLEALVRRLFLLDAEAPVEVSAGTDRDLQLERWDPGQASETELAAAFGLLVDSHYRTTPGDLRQWLDDPAARVWLARADGQILAVLWATDEGGLDTALADQVAAGRRRLRGHLLPQSLANHSGFAEAATQRLARIVRVAVHPESRRQGLGQRLVAVAVEDAGKRGLDAIGTSFGASPGLLAFWQRTGLQPVRLGLQREASSGEYAVQLLQGLSPQGRALAERIRARLAEHWPLLLARCWPDLDPELVLMLTASQPPAPALSPDDRRELVAFCQGQRGFELSLLALVRLSLQPGAADRLRASPQAALWVRAVLQGWAWPQLQAAGHCPGRRQGVAALRALAAELQQALSAS